MTPVPSLTKWGVSPHAELVYRTLTTYGPHRIGDINRSLDLPRQLVRSALDELHAVGGAAPANAQQRPDDRVWMASAPQAFVTSLKDRLERQMRAAYAVKDLLDGTVPVRNEQLHELSKTGAVRPLYGVPNTRVRLAELSAASHLEQLFMSPQTHFADESVKAAAPAERAANIRGVAIQGLFVPAPSIVAPSEYSLEMASYGTKNRLLPGLPVKMMIYDRRSAIMPLDPENVPKGAWEISAPSIVDSLVSLFLQRWERAVPLTYERKYRMELTSREREILSLLAEGHTDDVVASKLNISRRSISYAIAGLMERYHAKNRFQLGLMLGAHAARQSTQNGGDEKDDPEDT